MKKTKEILVKDATKIWLTKLKAYKAKFKERKPISSVQFLVKGKLVAEAKNATICEALQLFPQFNPDNNPPT